MQKQILDNNLNSSSTTSNNLGASGHQLATKNKEIEKLTAKNELLEKKVDILTQKANMLQKLVDNSRRKSQDNGSNFGDDEYQD